jgi:hypothetical protein
MRKHGKLLPGFATALIAAATILAPRTAHADHVVPPTVPANLQAPAGTRAFLAGHAEGTQAYICLPSGSGFAWTFFGPQATLFADNERQIITHFLSPNPEEGGTLRATWQHSQDTSRVWALSIAASTDPAFVAPGAIPWLLLRVVGEQPGRTSPGRLATTVFIHRVNTTGGVIPATGCSVAADVGRRSLVPYTADYFFYRFTHPAGS